MTSHQQFYFERLENGRFGIYGNGNLLATIGCQEACESLVSLLMQRQNAGPLDGAVRLKARHYLKRLEQIYSREDKLPSGDRCHQKDLHDAKVTIPLG